MCHICWKLHKEWSHYCLLFIWYLCKHIVVWNHKFSHLHFLFSSTSILGSKISALQISFSRCKKSAYTWLVCAWIHGLSPVRCRWKMKLVFQDVEDALKYMACLLNLTFLLVKHMSFNSNLFFTELCFVDGVT
jgi:hypothetical protein